MVASLIALLFALSAAAPARADPADLKDFGLVCFCTSRVATPHRLASSGNNGKILLLAKNGVTKSQLVAARQPASDAQLKELQDWGLLRRDRNRFTTAFPILGSAEMVALRSKLSPIAEDLSERITPDIKVIQAELKSRDQSQSTEAVLFAYILDGLTWRALDAAQALPSQQIDADHPYWNGTFWAVYPRQDNMPGTNSETVGTREIRMVWTPPVLAWFDQLKASKELLDVVVIDERAPDPIYVHGQRIAGTIASAVTAAKLDDVIASADPKQRILIATHELIWMLLDHANRDLAIMPPTVLKTGARSLEDIAPLVVISERAGKP